MEKKGNGLAICALVFSILFGLVGLVLGIIGANSYEKDSAGKTMSIIAITISCINMFLGFCLLLA